MCGLAGWFDVSGRAGPAPEPDRQRRALDLLSERGPDGEGVFVRQDAGVGLLHRRLWVVDREGGSQPMAGPGPGQVLAWNGELFDHVERRAALERSGETFSSRSDTEVLARLLARDGAGALPGLRAQFAIAWVTGLGSADEPATLLLARDAAGEKPLYWTSDGSRLWFASTLDALRALAPGPRSLDPEALSLYLSWGFVAAPQTIYRGVHKLRAGEWLRCIRGGEIETGLFRPLSGPSAPAPLRTALADAARIRLESADVPVGVFLSGGLDSLAITAVLRDVPGLRTFTVRARDPSLDEAADAAEVAADLGVSHTVIDPPADDPEQWRSVLARYGEPFGSQSALAVDAVSRAARDHVKVVLTGDGGDEALGGYPRHVLLRRLARVPRLPAGTVRGIGRLRRLRRAAELLGLDAADRYAAMYEVFGPWREKLVPDDAGSVARGLVRDLWAGARAGDLSAMLRVDRALELPDSHCVKVDVACMGNGVEARSPWLDARVVAAADALPPQQRIRGGRTKRALHELLASELSPAVLRRVLRRPKRGFTTGLVEAYRSDAVRDLLLGGPLDRVPGLRTDAVREILDEHLHGRGNHVFRLSTLVGLAVFADAHLS